MNEHTTVCSAALYRHCTKRHCMSYMVHSARCEAVILYPLLSVSFTLSFVHLRLDWVCSE